MNTPSVPNLVTSLNGPLLELERVFLERRFDIECWFHQQWLKTPAPFYSSVDLRNAGFKLSPVDTNLFPAGFNNLHADSDLLSLPAIETAILRYCQTATQVLIIAEAHTRNINYFEHLYRLKTLIAKAGFRVEIGHLLSNHALEHALQNGETLKLLPVQRTGNRIFTGKDFFPCAVVLNNDLSSGAPKVLQDLEEQYLIPPLALGWHNRSKQDNLDAYDTVSTDFAHMLGIDPWLIGTLHSNQQVNIDFTDATKTEFLQDQVSQLLIAIGNKYKQYNIKEKPFLMMKASAGTYGMGVIPIQDARHITALNRKQRNKMKVGKEGIAISQVILQEGVHTSEEFNNAVAEPVVYMIDHFVVGGFYRIHKNKAKDENLNAPGMHFSPLALAESLMNPKTECGCDDIPNRFYAYGVIARVAAAAAALEIVENKDNAA